MKIPGFTGQEEEIVSNHDTEDIKDLLLSKDGVFVDQVQGYCKSLQGLDDEEICKAVFDCLKQNVTYRADTAQEQLLKSPAALFHYKEGDCKSFSLFAGTVLRVMQIPYNYRLVSFDRGDPTPTHVYVVANPGTREQYIIDATLNKFNYEKPYTYKQDEKMLKFLSAPGNASGYHTFALMRYNRRGGNNGRVNGFLQDISSGQIKKAFTVDTKAPGVVDSNKQKADIITQFGYLEAWQKQKQALADTVKMSYHDKKDQIDAIQVKQNTAMTAIINDIVAEVSDDKRTADFNNVLTTTMEGLTAAAVSAIATPAAGVATGALLKLSISPSIPPSQQANIAALKQFTASEFPFYQKATNSNAGAAGKLILTVPSNNTQAPNVSTTSTTQTVKPAPVTVRKTAPTNTTTTKTTTANTNRSTATTTNSEGAATPPAKNNNTLIYGGFAAVAAYFLLK